MTLVIHLSRLTPTQLRSQLGDPDPVELHARHVTAENYKAAVRQALTEKDKGYD